MSSQPAPQEPATRGLARSLSQATLILALLLLAATFFLISPPPGRTYPSAIPWDNSSILHPITELMSFNGTFATIRGVEIKELALHLAAGIGLLLFALRIAMTRVWRMPRGEAGVVYAQLLLAAWVLLELLSVFWSSDPDLTRSQTLIYALALAWAISLAGNLRHRSATHLLAGLITITTLGAILSIWYYYERNPFHRASFPIGNPTSLAAVLLPAIICTLGYLAHTLLEWRRGKNTPNYALLVAAMFALLPLIWCFVLTRGRGATLALAVGLATMLIYTAGRRTRWLLAIGLGLGILLSGFGVYYSSRLDVTMARGAAMRFRLYAWRYATQLWQSRPYGGHGAGSYPRLAGQYSVRDQSLDPGAFMGRIVEHAHNELFEIISEVGITGGIAYVGGFVATFLAAAALLRRSPPGTQRWLVVGLVGSLAALLADSLVGSAQRLPGAPAILFTLLGMLWCVCNRPPATDEPAPAPIAGRRLLPLAAAIVCALAGLTATAVAIRGYRGNLYELRAQTDIQQGALTAALNDSRAAEELSLDPVSKLAMRHTALEVRLALARQAFSNFIEVTAAITTAPASPDQDPRPAAWKNAVRQAQQTYEAALELLRLVPALERTDVMAARVAELLAELHHRAGRDDAARQWSLVAEKAWRRQQQRTPFDVETLLALTSAQYHPSLEAHVALLRDAPAFSRRGGLRGRPAVLARLAAPRRRPAKIHRSARTASQRGWADVAANRCGRAGGVARAGDASSGGRVAGAARGICRRGASGGTGRGAV